MSTPQPTSRKLTHVFRAALRFARASLPDLAEEADYSTGSLDRYLHRAPPGPAVARALAAALARRGRRLLEYSERLRAAADEINPPEQGGSR